MGLFDRFFGDEAKIQKHTRRLTNRDSQPDDRDASARWLAERGTAQALIGLLQRFDLSLEHQMKDAGEKDLAYSLLLAKGEQAIEPTKAWLRQCKQFAMPLRLLGEIGGGNAAIETAYELLELELKKDDFKPEKKKGLLVWLADMRHSGASRAAEPFLKDFDEGVRYAAAEVIIAQGADTGRGPLLDVIANPKEESNRLKTRIAEIAVQRSWRVEDRAEALTKSLPSGFQVRDGRLLPA